MRPERGRAYNITLHLPDGDPEGIQLVTVSNWSGCAAVCPRTLLAETGNHPEFDDAGVYVLSGPADEGGTPVVYVGEADRIRRRLREHHGGKDFWTRATAFVRRGATLNRGHREYLEARLIQMARRAGRCDLTNADVRIPALARAELADMQGFLDAMLIVLPLLGLGVFEEALSPAVTECVLTLRGRGITATGYASGRRFTVRVGSQSAVQEEDRVMGHVCRIRRELVEDGTLVLAAGNLEFTRDHEFTSPSTAAQVVTGSNRFHYADWRGGSGRSLDQMQKDESAGDQA